MKFGGPCEVCAAKDAIIADLRAQLEATTKSLLAVTDARAYQMRYPPERPPREGPGPTPINSPHRARHRMWNPEKAEVKTMTPEEIEEQFILESDLEAKLAGRG